MDIFIKELIFSIYIKIKYMNTEYVPIMYYLAKCILYAQKIVENIYFKN